MENLSPFTNPLLDLHRAAGAEMQPYGEIEIPATFGQPQIEYASLHRSAGLIDRPYRGVLEVTGADRLSFLNGLLSNVTWDKERKQGIPAGSVVYWFLLNLKGRIVCDGFAIELGNRTLLEMDARMIEPVRGVFEQYRFAEKVQFRSLLGQIHEIALYGPSPVEAVRRCAETSVAALSTHHAAEATIAEVPCVLWRDAPTGTDGLNVIVPIAAAERVYQALMRVDEALEPGRSRVRPVGWAAFNSARIEAGRPLFGIDFDGVPAQTAYPSKKAQQQAAEDGGAGLLPAETGPLFTPAVSLSKCYIGQEVVARMHARNQVVRRIVGFRMDDDALPIAGAPVLDTDQGQVGIVTSSTLSPILSNASIGFAFLKKPHFAIGSKLSIPAEGQIRTATVVDLPFAREPEAGTAD